MAAAYVLKLDDQVKTQFAGKLWALPARVFARPLELYEGQTLLADNLEKELQLLNYTQGTDSNSTGSFKRNGNTFVILLGGGTKKRQPKRRGDKIGM